MSISDGWAILGSSFALEDDLCDLVDEPARCGALRRMLLHHSLLLGRAALSPLFTLIGEVSPKLGRILLLIGGALVGTAARGALSRILLAHKVPIRVLFASSVGIRTGISLDGLLSLLEDSILTHVIPIVSNGRCSGHHTRRVILEYLLIVDDIARRFLSRLLITHLVSNSVRSIDPRLFDRVFQFVCVRSDGRLFLGGQRLRLLRQRGQLLDVALAAATALG